MKYKLSEIAAICEGTIEGQDITVRSVFTDSRSFSAGEDSLFVAISGLNHNGHAYVNELCARGVRAFIIERDIAISGYPEAGFVRVDSSVSALQKLAGNYRAKFKGTVVGITGSNGKTIVKEWAAQLFPADVKVFRSPKSYNSQIGVPLSLLMIEGDEQVALIEAGISEPGEMGRLAGIVRPDIGVITNIGDAHQENFSSLEEKTAEKIQLFASAGTIIYNGACTIVADLIKKEYADRRLIDSSGEDDAITIPTDATTQDDGTCAASSKQALNDNSACAASSKQALNDNSACASFGDKASRENAASALAVSDALGFDHTTAVDRLSDLHPVAMRLELKEGLLNSLIVNDSYNSDINSLSIALDYMNNIAGGRPRMLILSDILQSGYAEDELYAKVAEMVNRAGIDSFIGIGSKLPRYSKSFKVPCSFHASAETWLKSFLSADIAGKAVLIKGNRNAQFERIAHTLERMSHTTVLEIDLDAMIHNLNAHRALIKPDTKMMAMVKAGGYGNGTYEVAAMLQHQGINYLAVAFADEGIQLRESGITMPIVVLNADSDSFGLMVANRLEPEIYSFGSLHGFVDAVKRYGERDYPIHIKLDTGMHRLGFEEKDIARLNEKLAELRGVVKISSLFSHFAVSDDPTQDSFTLSQAELFDRLTTSITETLSYKPLRHIANSAGIERFPQAQFDMVRIGIGLYGIGEAGGHNLRHISTLRTRIVQIKELDASQTVGYGRAGHLRRMSRVATIPIGYADGLNRHLGEGAWSVSVKGERVPTVGRICMDTCMIDVTGTEAQEGDPVFIFSPQQHNTVEDMARVLKTIPYEVMTSIAGRVKRIYTKE